MINLVATFLQTSMGYTGLLAHFLEWSISVVTFLQTPTHLFTDSSCAMLFMWNVFWDVLRNHWTPSYGPLVRNAASMRRFLEFKSSDLLTGSLQIFSQTVCGTLSGIVNL